LWPRIERRVEEMSISSPSKRALTTDTHQAAITSQVLRDDISPGLTTLLQNMGSKVRRSVAEGYVTKRDSSPPTPLSQSPVKQASTPPFFISSKDTLHRVYSPSSASTTPSSSPLKRARAEWEASERASSSGNACGADVDVHMKWAGSSESDIEDDSDDDDAVVITPAGIVGSLPASCTPPRPVRPLRKSKCGVASTNSMPPMLASVPFPGFRQEEQAADAGMIDIVPTECWNNVPVVVGPQWPA